MPEWSKGADLSSAIERCVGSNPTGCILFKKGNRVRAQDSVYNSSIEKHSCPSGLRGPSQERLSRDAWVRTPPDAFLRKRIEGTNGSNKEMSNDILRVVRGCSSDGRAFASHARGKGIDTPHLHCIFILGM